MLWRIIVKLKFEETRMDLFTRKYSVKERIFLYYMGFFAVFSFLTIITNIIYGLSFSFNYKWMFICVFCSFMGILAIKKIKTYLIHRIGIYVITLIILPIAWLSSSGLISPSIIYSIVVMLLINFILVGKERIILNSILTLVNLGLIALFYNYPQVFKQMNAQEQFIDWMVNIPVVFAFIAILLIVFERAYERERFVSFKKTKELEILSTTDALTGLKNRVNLNHDINLLINRYKEVGTIFSVIILDIDHFKTFNDTYGHLKGDECLKTISGILKDATKQKRYKAYRFGGEEFLILLSDTDQNEAVKFSQELKETIDNYAIPNINSDVKSIITVSMGISTTSENYNVDIDTLLKYADKALYKAKTSGRDKIVCFDK